MQKVLSVFRAMFQRKWTMGVATLVIFAAVVAGGFALQPSLSVGAASSCSSVYTVRFGDTLGRIALRYHSSVHAIAQASHIWNPDLIFPGQRLCIPASHRVSSGRGSDPRGPSGRGSDPRGPSGRGSDPRGSSVTNMISSVFGPYASGALRVASCESSLNPRAYNPISIGGSHAVGVFQILYPSTWMGTPQSANSPYDPMANILAAHSIFVRDGYSWREWACQP